MKAKQSESHFSYTNRLKPQPPCSAHHTTFEGECLNCGWKPMKKEISVLTPKRYACKRCGHETVHTTNHYGETWSFGRVSVCPECPPYAKYPEFGGQTVWICLDKPNI